MVLMLKTYTMRGRTTLTDCAAILDGPFIEGQDTQDMNPLEGNKTSPVVIRCQVKCSNYTDTHHRYNPALALVVTELGIYKEIQNQQYGYDTQHGLYQRITYTPSDYCSQSNNYMMQYSFAIYPTIKMDKTVARCGVSFLPSRPPCWGEPVVFVRYVNSSMTDDDLTPMACTPPSTSDSTTNDFPTIGPGGHIIGSETSSTTTSISSPDPTPDDTPTCTNYQQIVIPVAILGVLMGLLLMTIVAVVILSKQCIKKPAPDTEKGVVDTYAHAAVTSNESQIDFLY